MSPAPSCPYRITAEPGQMRCFDSRLIAGVERPAAIVEKYCLGNFRDCPYYRSFEGVRSECPVTL